MPLHLTSVLCGVVFFGQPHLSPAAQERGEVATYNRTKDFSVVIDNAKPATDAELIGTSVAMGPRRG